MEGNRAVAVPVAGLVGRVGMEIALIVNIFPALKGDDFHASSHQAAL